MTLSPETGRPGATLWKTRPPEPNLWTTSHPEPKTVSPIRDAGTGGSPREGRGVRGIRARHACAAYVRPDGACVRPDAAYVRSVRAFARLGVNRAQRRRALILIAPCTTASTEIHVASLPSTHAGRAGGHGRPHPPVAIDRGAERRRDRSEWPATCDCADIGLTGGHATVVHIRWPPKN